MKVVSTSITNLYKGQVMIVERDETYFNSPFHFHPEFELVYIVEGFGKRIIGNKIERFEKGEMVLIGPNLPHLWSSDESYYVTGSKKRCKSIVVYFNPGIFSEAFYDMSESMPLNQLFTKSQRGIRIEGDTKNQVLSRFNDLRDARNLEKVICLLDILNTIANASDISCISDQPVPEGKDGVGRLTRLFQYVDTNYNHPIRLSEAAAVTNLTPESFCRFFKQKTGKSFIEYLQETRMSHACRSLLQTDHTVAEIAYQCGFRTASNFNKLFRKFTGHSPTEYRKSILDTHS